ncbi:MAG: hypothetical protein EOP06_21165, partial [Proteobacteria bacterium]
MPEYQIEFINNTDPDTDPVTDQTWTIANVVSDVLVSPEMPHSFSHSLDNPIYNITVKVASNEATGVLIHEGDRWGLNSASGKLTLNTSVPGTLTFTSTIADNVAEVE